MASLRNTVYLDHHATTPLCQPSVVAMQEAMEATGGNPSSVHGSGQAAKHLLERARAQVAAALGVPSRSVLFTSGATEANALAWRTGTSAARGYVATSPYEHASVELLADSVRAEGWEVETLAIDARGELQEPPSRPQLDFISVALVSNELGLVTATSTLEALRASCAGMMHVDATQALGKLADVQSLRADVVSVSAHKIGGPKGIGALVVRDGVSVRPLWPGHQERGLRGGTENLIGAVGFGAACAALHERVIAMPRVRRLRDSAAERLSALPIAPHFHLKSVPKTAETGTCLSVAYPGLEAADLVMALDLEDVAVSAGSACSSGTLQPSPVIARWVKDAPNAAALAKGTLRISFGPENTEEDVTALVDALARVLPRLYRAAANASV